MNYPSFFDTIQPIVLIDPLADILGAFDGGKYTLSYTDIVKASGHSCPTVASAFLMLRLGLETLYPNTPVIRGNIDVSFKEVLHVGATGVISLVASHITGATDVSGFKGFGTQFVRHGLMHFNVPLTGMMQLKRMDTGDAVEVSYDLSALPADPTLNALMQNVLQKKATEEEKNAFKTQWQARVETIIKHPERFIILHP